MLETNKVTGKFVLGSAKSEEVAAVSVAGEGANDVIRADVPPAGVPFPTTAIPTPFLTITNAPVTNSSFAVSHTPTVTPTPVPTSTPNANRITPTEKYQYESYKAYYDKKILCEQILKNNELSCLLGYKAQSDSAKDVENMNNRNFKTLPVSELDSMYASKIGFYQGYARRKSIEGFREKIIEKLALRGQQESTARDIIDHNIWLDSRGDSVFPLLSGLPSGTKDYLIEDLVRNLGVDRAKVTDAIEGSLNAYKYNQDLLDSLCKRNQLDAVSKGNFGCGSELKDAMKAVEKDRLFDKFYFLASNRPRVFANSPEVVRAIWEDLPEMSRRGSPVARGGYVSLADKVLSPPSNSRNSFISIEGSYVLTFSPNYTNTTFLSAATNYLASPDSYVVANKSVLAPSSEAKLTPSQVFGKLTDGYFPQEITEGNPRYCPATNPFLRLNSQVFLNDLIGVNNGVLTFYDFAKDKSITVKERDDFLRNLSLSWSALLSDEKKTTLVRVFNSTLLSLGVTSNAALLMGQNKEGTEGLVGILVDLVSIDSGSPDYLKISTNLAKKLSNLIDLIESQEFDEIGNWDIVESILKAYPQEVLDILLLDAPAYEDQYKLQNEVAKLIEKGEDNNQTKLAIIIDKLSKPKQR